jgi:hypothetical protein
MQFSKGETKLLSKGLQYNLTHNNTTWWLVNLVIETEAAISLLKFYSSPNIIRHIISRRIRWAGHVAYMGEKRKV